VVQLSSQLSCLNPGESELTQLSGNIKNGSIRVPGGGDYLSDVVRAGKDEKECGKRENEREAVMRDLADEEYDGRFHVAAMATL